MQTSVKLAAVLILGALIAGPRLLHGDGQTQPSQFYSTDEVQFVPQTVASRRPSTPAPRDAALGDLLFTDVVWVHFTGPGHPPNPDGSLGGLVPGDGNSTMKIYENYIAVETEMAGGGTYRVLHAYDVIGKIEQQTPNPNVENWE
ncbi:hypothetical protein [Rubinisphaera margarita]|uniref:hypothetical protein n=1 Tax=Rubinisphaera margarita TaxID=2909586 RepID=UPI001EE967DA|nr:hypothetical protein [Rubinisphaera margarita]MCG6156744.1 hypothetical protein [Rubinisphaera margarita]